MKNDTTVRLRRSAYSFSVTGTTADQYSICFICQCSAVLLSVVAFIIWNSRKSGVRTFFSMALLIYCVDVSVFPDPEAINEKRKRKRVAVVESDIPST